MNLRQIMKYEKENMNRIRFIMNYRVVPLYLITGALIITTILILMSIDEAKYTTITIALFILFGFVTGLLLLSVPFVRKREITIEMQRNDFGKDIQADNSIYDFSNEEDSLLFDTKGMTMNDIFYLYSNLQIYISTSNYLNRVLISIVFQVNEHNYCEIPFNGDSITMIKKFNLMLRNPEILEYIMKKKSDAFTQIYKTGHVKILD